MAERKDMPTKTELPSNARNKNEEKKAIQPVANGTIRKQPLGSKMKDAFLGEEAQNVKTYLFWDVLIPAAKDTIADLVKKGIDAILYGKSKAPDNIKRDRGSSYVSYNSYSRGRYEVRNDPPWRTPQEPRYNPRAAHDFDEIDFDEQKQAERVLSRMVDILMQDGEVSVADFYALSNVKGSWTDESYGWYELGSAICMRNHRGKWYIDLPSPVPIRRGNSDNA